MAVDLEDKPQIYDDGSPSWKTNLRDDELEAAYDAPSATDDDLPDGHPDKKAASVADLSEAETNPSSKDEGTIGDGYNADDDNFLSRAKGFAMRNRKKAALGAGIGGGISAVLISLFMSLVPLKINHILENLKSKYQDRAQNAVSRRMEKHFEVYMQKHVFKGMQLNPNVCKSTATIDKTCVSTIDGDTYAKRMFRGWKEGRLENKLAKNYGIEFKYENDKFFMKIDGLQGPVDATEFAKGRQSLADFEQVNGSKLRAKIDEALDGETRFKGLLVRLRIMRLLKNKYGNTKYCMVVCKVEDKKNQIAAWKNGLKEKAIEKVIFADIVQNHSGILSVALGCIIDPSCSSDSPGRAETDEADAGLGKEERTSKIQKDIEGWLEKKGVSLEKETLEKVTKVVEDFNEAGSMTKYVIIRAAEEAGLKEFAEKAIPVVGWIDTGAQIIGKIKGIGPQLRRVGYTLAAADAAAIWIRFMVANDENKEGNSTPETYAALGAALGGYAGDGDHQGQPAEASPVYQSIVGENSTVQTSLLDILSGNKAYAEDLQPTQPDTKGYSCDDKSYPETGKKVCPEEEFTKGFAVTDLISRIFATPPLSWLATLADFWNGTAGRALKAASNVIGDMVSAIAGYIPVVRDFEKALGDVFGSLIERLGKWLFPSAVSVTMSGARTFNLMTAGSDSTGNDFAHYGIGGKLLTPEQVAAIDNDQATLRQEQFNNRPVYARLFDTKDSMSLVSKLAMAVPMDTGNYAQHTASTLLRNPLGVLTKSFGSFFMTKKAFAATAEPDPFGIPQYGYALDDPAINIDPDLLTPEYCKQLNDDWANNQAAIDELTGLDKHTATNPCLLEKATTVAGGKMFTDEVDGDTAGGTSSSTTNQDVNTAPISNDSIDQSQTAEIPGGGGVRIRATVLPQFMAMVEAAKRDGIDLFPISSAWRDPAKQIALRKQNCPDWQNSPPGDCSPPTAKPGTSQHEKGNAIDFGNMCFARGKVPSCHGNARWEWLTQNASKFGFKQLPSEAWHWSTTGT